MGFYAIKTWDYEFFKKKIHLNLPYLMCTARIGFPETLSLVPAIYLMTNKCYKIIKPHKIKV